MDRHTQSGVHFRRLSVGPARTLNELFYVGPTTACNVECRYDANAAGSYLRPGFSSLSRWRNRVTAMRLAPADVTSQRVLFLGSPLHRSHGCSHCYVLSC